MNLDFSDEQEMLRNTLRRFVQEQVLPQARLFDLREQFPKAWVATLAEMGLLGVTVEPRFGGAGYGAMVMAIVVEELARGDGSLALTVASHNGLCGGHIARFGNESQKERFLRPLARGEKLGAWALTEPHSGSDAGAMRTRAQRDGEGWRITGTKTFITQGTLGEVFVVLAVTDPTLGTRGVTAFILEKGMPGFTQQPLKDKLGMRASDTAVLYLDEVRVPEENRLGEVGRGFANALAVLDFGRITLGALALGLGRAGFDAARRYARERYQFGRPIGEQQAIQWKLADMATSLEAAALLVYRAAWRAETGLPFGREAAIAKLFASEAAMRATDDAIQIHGGYGYSVEYPVERAYRDAKLCTIGEGTSEIQRLVIARHVIAEQGGRAQGAP